MASRIILIFLITICCVSIAATYYNYVVLQNFVIENDLEEELEEVSE